MRWDDLLGELVAQAADADLRERDDAVAELSRDARAHVGWAELAAHARVAVRVPHLGTVEGTVARVTRDWILVETPRAALAVAHAAVLGVAVTSTATSAPARRLDENWGWGYAFRAFARDRDEIHVTRWDGSMVTGSVRQVGADHAELARDGGGSELVPFAAVVAVRCPLAR